MPSSTQKYFVTTTGYDILYSPPDVTASHIIEIPKEQSIFEWFASKPKLCHRFTYTPVALLNFYKVN